MTTLSRQQRSTRIRRLSHRRRTLFSLVWLVLTGVLGSSFPGPAWGAPPNLVVIMADDISAKDIPAYGSQHHSMPTLDRLAAEGIQFATAFATPICHPSRLEIMTGQYGFHNGVYNNTNRRAGRIDPAAERMSNHLTFAHLLQKAGYATALAGKWQLSGQVPHLIVETGFDEYMVWGQSRQLPPGIEHTGAFTSQAKEVPSPYWHPSIIKNGAYFPTHIDDYAPDLFTDFLIDFAHRHQDQPFLLYYPMVLPHSPYWPTPSSNPSKTERFVYDRANFGEMVDYIDVLLERLVQALESMGLRENTIIIFTADNGSQVGEFKAKGKPTQLGVRVPLIVNGPGLVPALGVRRELTDFTDILPTLVDLAESELPQSGVFDGHSFAPLLRGEPYTPREWIFSYLGDRRVLRDRRWLLEYNSPHQFGQLFDCGESPNFEDCVLITDFTDPEVIATKQRFEAILANKPAPRLPIRINFQPQTSPLPHPAYEDDVDYGEPLRDQNRKTIGNQLRSGVSFGWSIDTSDMAQDRNLNPDQRLDTFVPFRHRAKWEITLANGDYDVMVSIGDAKLASTHTLKVEGTTYWHQVKLGPNEFRQQKKSITVSDGYLTLDAGNAPDFATRINFIEIVPLDAPLAHMFNLLN